MRVRTEAQKESERRWYQSNKATIAAKKKRKKQRLNEIVREYKNRPCLDCGKRYPYYVMDFDHVKGKKRNSVSIILGLNNLDALLEEIQKCEVVCANCHRERTFGHKRNVA